MIVNRQKKNLKKRSQCLGKTNLWKYKIGLKNGQKRGLSEPEVVRLTCTLDNKRQTNLS
jgi:nitrogen fixation protein